MSLTSRLSSKAVVGAALACIALLSAGCEDNVTCVFTGSCNGGGGAISDNPAALPVDGDWVLDAPPKIETGGVFPDGLDNAGTTPIVVVFSESMQEESLQGAIEIVSGTGGAPAAGMQERLVADGRVLVLLPPAATGLDPGPYLLVLADDATVLDLTGQELATEPGTQIGTFSVTDTPPAAPQLVMTFPGDDAQNQSETTAIVAVFDRPVLGASVDPDSFDVRVNGADPANDPPATAIVPGDTRAFQFRSLDGDGRPVPLGTDADVQLLLSPAGNPITDVDGGETLAPATIDFQTLPFAPPVSASLLSDPPDAIGLANLTDGDPEELTIELELEGLQPNDSIDLFLFGEERTEEPDPILIALQPRAVRLSGTAPILTATFTREDIPIQISSGSAPDEVHFNDGPVTFAFRARRGAVVTPLRVLDLDADPDTILDPVLDTLAPAVDSLIGSNDTSEFRTELRGLSLAGLVDGGERLRSVEVEAELVNNGALAPAISAGDGAGGAFLAAPVPLDVVPDGNGTFRFVARDTALNAGPELDGAFTQVGVVGPAPIVLGSPIEVEVFDSRTLAPLVGARVIVHSDRGNGVDFPFFQTALTVAGGTTSVGTEGAPSVAAIVTVVLDDYDLFTLHGVPSARLSVPLRETNVGTARASGAVVADDPGAAAFLEGLDRRFDDTRHSVALPRGFLGSADCSEGDTLSCGYGLEPIQDEELGARSFFAGDFLQTELAFSPTLLLQAFALSVPFAPAASLVNQIGDLEVEFLLSDPEAPPEEAAQAIPPFTFRVPTPSGVTGTLADDADTTGVPFASVDVLIPGLTGSLAVAQALAYDRGGNEWTIRGALPGAITAAGSLGSDGIVDTDPFVRVELADDDGNAAGIRPRLSTIEAGGLTPTFEALAVPTQLTPAPAAASGGEAFTIELTHVIVGTEPGLYRVELMDGNLRGWTLWRFDLPGAAPIPIRVVDVADAGATALADGTLLTSVSAFAWGGLDPTDFLWTDVEREFELFSRAATFSFTKP